TEAVAEAGTETNVESESLDIAQAAAPSNPVHHCTKQNDGTDYTDWSYIYFGSYPQSEVTDAATISAIDSAIPSSGVSGDVGVDVWVGGTKYRRISKSDTNYDGYFGSDTYRYFKWERIKWKVLSNNGSTLFVVADKGLDCKRYNETNTNVTWETCTLRSWLGKQFYNAAFSAAEQSAIVTQSVVNNDNPYYNTEGGNNTNDKVYLLSIEEVTKPAYGFCEDYSIASASRRFQTSDYSNARGAYRSTISDYMGNCWWWLRSPGGDSYRAAYVCADGYVASDGRNGNDVGDYIGAVVPALHIDLSSGIWSMSDDGTSGAGGAITPVTVPKNASADDVLSHMNLNTLISDTSLAGEKINGPTVTIAGKTFPLFTIDASVNLKLNDSIQAKVDEEKKTVQVLIGFDKFSGSAKLDKDTNSSNYWSESYQQVKSLYTGMTGKKVDSTKLWNQFSKLRGKLRKHNCSMGIDANASVAGYMEFSYATGEIVYSEGGIILEASLGTSVDYPLPPAPAVYVTFGVEAEFNGHLKLVRESTMKYTPSIDAGIDLSAKLGIGAGAKKIKTYAELGLKGTIGLQMSLPADSLEKALQARLSAKVYFESKIFGFNGPNYGPQEFASYQIYPRTVRENLAVAGGADLASFDMSGATIAPRMYLAEPSSISHMNGDFQKDNLYQYSAPQLAEFNDGSKLLLWIDDDGKKSDVNRTSLFYSIYDGGTWSEAKVIGETGGANDYPYVYCDGTKAHIVWQKAKPMREDATLDEVLKNVDLYYMTYEDAVFSEAEQITENNETYEMLHTIVTSPNKIAIAWVENSENSPFQGTGVNSIKVKECVNGVWTETVIASDVESVGTLACSYVENQLVVIYETAWNESVIHIIKDDLTETRSGYGIDLKNGALYYNDADNLVCYDLYSGAADEIISGTMADYMVLDDGIHKMIVAADYNGFTSELAVYLYDDSTNRWSQKIILTDEGKYIRDYSASLDRNGKLSAALNLVEVDEEAEEIYQNASLVVMSFSDFEDITLTDSVYYEEENVLPGRELPLHFDVTNNGLKDITDFNVSILDESGNVLQSGMINCAIAPGETVQASYIYRLPADLKRHRVTLKVSTTKETKLSDNIATVEIGYADINLQQLYLQKDGEQYKLIGRVSNIGYDAAEEVVANVYSENREGMAIGTANIPVIESGEAEYFQVVIPEEYLAVNPLASGNVLFVEIATQSDEYRFDNNTMQYLIQSSEDVPLVLNCNELALGINETSQLEVTSSQVVDLTSEDVEWSSSDQAVATVENGVVKAVGEGTCEITADIRGYQAICKVTVTNRIAVTGIYMEEAGAHIILGESKQLTAKVLPLNATNQKMNWETQDSAVATVDSSGTVTGISVGSTVVSAITEDGYKVATCAVTVGQVVDKTYTLSFSGGENITGNSPVSITGTAGSMVTLPSNTYEKEGMLFAGWSDGDAIYDAGSLYIIKNYDIIFTAQWKEADKKEWSITVICGDGGTITPSDLITVSEGESQTFTMQALQGYSLSEVFVDGESVGAVSTYTFHNVVDHHVIEAKFMKNMSGGEQMEADNGHNNIKDGNSDEMSNKNPEGQGQKPTPPKDSKITVTNLRITSLSKKLAAGKTVRLTANITPESATDKSVTWKVSNSKYASITKTGKLTLKKAGVGKTVTVTASAQDGSGVTASCKVKIMKDAVTKVQIKQGSKTLKNGKTITGKAGSSVKLKAAVTVSNKKGKVKSGYKANKTVTWTSNNTKYATVNQSGKVKLLKAGKG
ncbi:MAG: Ig-like domain-containing protein, partial [Lachnospiraceae bacterium]|nr:Ig-like domain-containing protein [Lachnospiraceae bacterium]